MKFCYILYQNSQTLRVLTPQLSRNRTICTVGSSGMADGGGAVVRPGSMRFAMVRRGFWPSKNAIMPHGLKFARIWPVRRFEGAMVNWSTHPEKSPCGESWRVDFLAGKPILPRRRKTGFSCEFTVDFVCTSGIITVGIILFALCSKINRLPNKIHLLFMCAEKPAIHRRALLFASKNNNQSFPRIPANSSRKLALSASNARICSFASLS